MNLNSNISMRNNQKMGVEFSELSQTPVSRGAQRRANMGQNWQSSGPRRRKWDIAKTIRGAVEFYIKFAITL